MKILTVYQLNGLKYFMNYNNGNDMDMNDNHQNGDVSSGIGLINSHTLPQCNKLSNLNVINWGLKWVFQWWSFLYEYPHCI